jgi:hypothetical protein
MITPENKIPTISKRSGMSGSFSMACHISVTNIIAQYVSVSVTIAPTQDISTSLA